MSEPVKHSLLAAYLSVDAELVHRVYNTEQSLDGLGLLANHCLVNVQVNVVVVEVGLHLLAVEVKDVHVHDGQATAPSLVAVGKVLVASIEDVVDEGEVIFDLLVARDMKAGGCLDNGSLKVRHIE
jgi:hypothetical protein